MSLPDPVRTERLVLPLWTAADVTAIRTGARLPRWHPDFPREDDRDAATLWQEHDPWGPRSVVRGATVLGSVGFFGPPEAAGDGVDEAEVGFGLVAEARGWGFATEALAGLLAHTDAAGVRVRARVDPGNRASVRVLATSGFTELRGDDGEGQLVLARPLR
ncbi:GNAT family N-acetyltransferase [Nocardioides dongkuii]|uniref:GNAT family N-acetyltransferase n=1 Tax=Nocardioides dongkuii TaxID=2760089 RepID=UPI0015F93EC0|nr:GNAT family N-acetyltransferase [Nocardioides dongkuii]